MYRIVQKCLPRCKGSFSLTRATRFCFDAKWPETALKLPFSINTRPVPAIHNRILDFDSLRPPLFTSLSPTALVYSFSLSYHSSPNFIPSHHPFFPVLLLSQSPLRGTVSPTGDPFPSHVLSNPTLCRSSWRST